MENAIRWKSQHAPKISARFIERQFNQLPNVADVIPDVVRRKSAMLFIVSSIWSAAIIFAYMPPIAFLLALPTEAWGLISALCGVLGTLVTTYVVKRFDAKINQRTNENTTQQEFLKQNIQWALQERQELFKESEAVYGKMLASRDKEIERLSAHLDAALEELKLLRKSNPEK